MSPSSRPVRTKRTFARAAVRNPEACMPWISGKSGPTPSQKRHHKSDTGVFEPGKLPYLRQMARRWAVILMAAGLCFHGGKARATGLSGAELSVVRDATATDCPDANELERRILALWMAPATTAALRVDVRFARTPTGYQAELRASGARAGTRYLSTEAATCAPLSDAVTVALALLLDMVPASELPRPRPVVVPTAVITHRERRRPPLHLGLSSGLGLTLGALGSQPAGFMSASVLARRGHFVAEALAFYVAPRTVDYEPGFVKVGLWGGAVNACYSTRVAGERGVAWRPCLGLRLGKLSGAGTGYDVNSTASQEWFALAGSTHLELPLSARVRFVSGLMLWLPVARHELIVQGRGTAFETWILAGGLQLGLELTIW